MSILLIVTLILAFVLHPRGKLKLPKKVATRKVVLAESLVSQPRTLGTLPQYIGILKRQNMIGTKENQNNQPKLIVEGTTCVAK